MTQISSSLILKRSAHVDLMCRNFRNMIENLILEDYLKAGHVQPVFAAMVYNFGDALVPYKSISYENFPVNEEGYLTLRKFNWEYQTPLICCMTAFMIEVTHFVTGTKEDNLLFILEDPLGTRFKVMRAIDLNQRKLEQVKETRGILESLPKEMQLFGNIIDKGFHFQKDLS